MATTLQSIITSARERLIEGTARFWSDAELLGHASLGIRDLWKALKDTNQDYFLTIDETNVSMAANSLTLTGVPTDLAHIRGIEPRSTNSTNVDVFFRPKNYTHPEFAQARRSAAVEPNGVTILYHAIGAGSPVAAPTIYVAPMITSALPLQLAYIPTIGTLTTASTNPIPGETDHAIICWTVAWARAKEREDRSPDAEWLAAYATEKSNLIVSATPRQEDEAKVVEAIFETEWV